MLKFKPLLVFSSFMVFGVVHKVESHGMMLEPVGRSSRWRFDSTAPKNYNDNELFCGGFNKQWNTNKGKCGLCGDDYSIPTPRPNEIGGKYGQGVIVRSYRRGNLIPIGVKLTANHRGYFYFNLCDLDNSRETEECYQKHKLKLITGKYLFYVETSNPGWFNITLQLPKDLSCKHCVIRWAYNAGNNWGPCSNGTWAVGCGPQENFRSCADIEIRRSRDLFAENPLSWLPNEDNYLNSIDSDDEDNYALSYDDEIYYNVPVEEVPGVVHEFNQERIKTKQEILKEIKDLFQEILDETKYLEIENVIDNLNISDD